MENNLVIFNYKNLGSVRSYLDSKGNPWFCLTDVCKILRISNASQLSERLDSKGISSIYTLINGGKQELTFINESNLYETIFKSRKPEAKEFRFWVTSEVIPSIRKNGYYNMRNLSYSEKVTFVLDNMNKDLQEFKRTVNDRFIKERRITDTGIKDLEENVIELLI